MKTNQQASFSCCGVFGEKTVEPTEPAVCCGIEAAPRVVRKPAVTITRAAAGDLEGVLNLLRSIGLPTAGVADHFDSFFVAKDEQGHLAGAIGFERHGSVGLLRSASISRGRQRLGVGSKLTKVLIDFAIAEGVKELVLFTTDAQSFFGRFGFLPARREEYAAQLRNSTQWSGCCSSAEFMRVGLQ